MTERRTLSTLESVSRILAVGHSLIADTGASQRAYGAIHRFANLFPADTIDLSYGGAMACLPGVNNPDDGSLVGTTKAGWGWVFNQVTNRERTTGIDTTFTATTSAGQAAGTSDAVAASAGAVIATMPVIAMSKTTPANAQLTYIQTIPDGTHVSFYDVLTNSYVNGDPLVAAPDARYPNKQVVILEFDWNDLIYMGPTAWNTAFVHCYRSIIARLRESHHYPATSSLVVYAGTWSTTTPAVGFGDGAGASIRTCTVNGGTATIYVPPMDSGEQLVLFFRTRAAGDGANWTMQVDGDSTHTFTYDTRNINGFFYNSGTGTRAANGFEMSSCKIIRGLASGAHTIVLTATTVGTNADFMGFGILPADLPPMLVLQPYRWFTYAGLPAADYTPTDTDFTNMDTAIKALVAEFTNPTSDVNGGTAWADTGVLYVQQDSVMAKARKNYSYDGVHANDRGHGERGVAMMNVINSAAIANRSLIVPTVIESVTTLGSGWYSVASNSSSASIRMFNGWQNYASGASVLQYKKVVPTRRVQIRGEIIKTDNYTGTNGNIFILPVGYRPLTELAFTVNSYFGPFTILVSPTGQVFPGSFNPSSTNTGVEGWVNLAGIEFDAEQ